MSSAHQFAHNPLIQFLWALTGKDPDCEFFVDSELGSVEVYGVEIGRSKAESADETGVTDEEVVDGAILNISSYLRDCFGGVEVAEHVGKQCAGEVL